MNLCIWSSCCHI